MQHGICHGPKAHGQVAQSVFQDEHWPVKLLNTAILLGIGMFFSGCQTPLPPGAEPGPHGTMAFNVLIEASEPGARIDANGEDMGNTPVTLKIFGDRDGTFHDFGSYHFVIRALPLTTNQFPQARFFGTGRAWSREDRIPERIYFDMNQPSPVYVLPPPPMSYGPPPFYYDPWPYYHYSPWPYYHHHRPGIRFHFPRNPPVHRRHR